MRLRFFLGLLGALLAMTFAACGLVVEDQPRLAGHGCAALVACIQACPLE